MHEFIINDAIQANASDTYGWTIRAQQDARETIKHLSHVLFFVIPPIVLIQMTIPQLSPQMNLTSLPHREVACASIILN